MALALAALLFLSAARCGGASPSVGTTAQGLADAVEADEAVSRADGLYRRAVAIR